MVDGGAVALMDNRLVVQRAPPVYRPRPGGFSGPGRYAPLETRARASGARTPHRHTHTEGLIREGV